MSNLKAKDGDSITKFLKATGIGTDDDPLIIEHSNTAALQQLQQLVTQLTNIIQQLGGIAQLKIQLQDLISITGIINNFPTVQPINGTVSIDNFPPPFDAINIRNFPTTQAVNGNINVTNFPATQSITDSQVSYTETLFPLNANGTFTGSNRDAQNKNSVRGWIWTNTSGTLYVDQSINSTTWRQTDTIVINGNALEASFYTFRLICRYYRLRYVNGNTKQTNFEIISTVFGVGL